MCFKEFLLDVCTNKFVPLSKVLLIGAVRKNGEILLLHRFAQKHLGPSLCCFLAEISQPLQVRSIKTSQVWVQVHLLNLLSK